MTHESNPGSPSFADLTLRQFVESLGSAEPVPGGGSASAIAASLGSSLLAMVAALSRDRPRYAAHDALHVSSIHTGRRLASRFLELADDDARAYASFAAALKRPRETDEDQAGRQSALSEAARAAAEVPLATVEACLELAAAVESLVGRSNVNAASDLNVAALLCEAAARGAGENVLVNLPAIGDEAYTGETTARVVGLLNSIEELVGTVHEGVRSGQSREPLEPRERREPLES